VRDAAAKGHMSRYGLSNPSLKFSDEQIVSLRNEFKAGVSCKKLMAKHGISETHFYNIVNGKKRNLILRTAGETNHEGI